MMDKLDELAGLVGWTGPGVVGVDWGTIERELGVMVPSSFKAYVARFPAGTYQDWLLMEQPRTPAETSGYLERLEDWLKGLRIATRSKEGFPYRIYPRIPGLLPWGDINGEYQLCWHVTSVSDDSPQIVLVDTSSWMPLVEVLHGDLVDCLLAILRGQIPELIHVTEACTPPDFGPFPLGPGRRYRRADDYWINLDPARLLVVDSAKTDAVRELIGLVGGQGSPQVVDWPAVERRLRHPLPADYKRFIELVGPGRYGDVTVANPGGPVGDLPGLVELTAEALDRVNDGALVPAPSGPVVWGMAPGGYYCGWLFGDYPSDRRPVILFTRGGDTSGRQHSMTSYLAWHVQHPKDWLMSPWRIGEPE